MDGKPRIIGVKIPAPQPEQGAKPTIVSEQGEQKPLEEQKQVVREEKNEEPTSSHATDEAEQLLNDAVIQNNEIPVMQRKEPRTLGQAYREQAARDVLPVRGEPEPLGTDEDPVERAKALYAQKQREKQKQGFTGRISGFFSSLFKK